MLLPADKRLQIGCWWHLGSRLALEGRIKMAAPADNTRRDALLILIQENTSNMKPNQQDTARGSPLDGLSHADESYNRCFGWHVAGTTAAGHDNTSQQSFID